MINHLGKVGKALRNLNLCGPPLDAVRGMTVLGVRALAGIQQRTFQERPTLDNDQVRHGQPTVQNKWDTSTSILAGDAIFVEAQLPLCISLNASAPVLNSLNSIQFRSPIFPLDNISKVFSKSLFV